MPDGEQGVSIITDHPYQPRGQWWALCRTCRLGEAAHEKTGRFTIDITEPVALARKAIERMRPRCNEDEPAPEAGTGSK